MTKLILAIALLLATTGVRLAADDSLSGEQSIVRPNILMIITDQQFADVDVDPPLDLCPTLPDNFGINHDEAEAVQTRRHLRSDELPNAQMMAMEFSEDEWRQYRWAYLTG